MSDRQRSPRRCGGEQTGWGRSQWERAPDEGGTQHRWSRDHSGEWSWSGSRDGSGGDSWTDGSSGGGGGSGSDGGRQRETWRRAPSWTDAGESKHQGQDKEGKDEWSTWWDRALSKARAKLAQLPGGSLVAVVTFAGSFCPVTRGHIACVVGSRELLLGRERRGERWVPKDLEEFSEVVGFIGCNSDKYVTKKLAPLPILTKEERLGLIDLAAEEHDWLCSVNGPWDAVEQLRSRFPELRLIHFVIDGADAALWNKPWRKTTQEQRCIIVEREGDPGQDNGVDALRKAITQDVGDYRSTPRCILWPPLSSASSTRSRRALIARDLASLAELLHPKVMARLVESGPYQP